MPLLNCAVASKSREIKVYPIQTRFNKLPTTPSGRKMQFIQGAIPATISPSIDDRLKFAQLLRLLGTPTWQGGAD